MASAAELLTQRQQKLQSQPSLVQEGKRLEQESGLGARRTAQQDIRRNILDTRRTLRQTPKNVQNRLRRLGGPATAFAQSRLTTAAQEPITQQLQRFGESGEFEAAGVRDIQSDIRNALALQKQERDFGTSEFNRAFGLQAGVEQQQSAAALQRELLNARIQADKAAQLQAAAEARRQSEAFAALFGDQGGGEAGGFGPITPTSGQPGFQRATGGAVELGLGGLGQALLTAGSLGQVPLGARGGGTSFNPALRQAQIGQAEATRQRQAIEGRGQRRVEEFLRSNPQFRGQVRTLGDLTALSRAGINTG